MSQINILARKLEEAYQSALKAGQFEGANLSAARTAFFEAVANKIEKLDVRDPVRVALALHETLYTDQRDWETTHSITQVDLGILTQLVSAMFEVLCGDNTEATAALTVFESFQTGRVGGNPITHH